MKRYQTPEPVVPQVEEKPPSPEVQAVDHKEAERIEQEEEEKRRKERFQKEKDALRAPFQDLMNQQQK